MTRFVTFLLRGAAMAYLLVSLPVVMVFSGSEFVRFVAIQTVTHWKGKFTSLSMVYVGDSLTAGGRNWGRPFEVINLAGNEYTIRQIEHQLYRAEVYDPDRVFILAGTNDLLDPPGNFSMERFESDYDRLLDRAEGMSCEVFVTLIPHTQDPATIQKISDANAVVRRLANQYGATIIDLNPKIAPDGLLLPEYSVDGVHMTPAGYRIWRQEIQLAILNASH